MHETSTNEDDGQLSELVIESDVAEMVQIINKKSTDLIEMNNLD